MTRASTGTHSCVNYRALIRLLENVQRKCLIARLLVILQAASDTKLHAHLRHAPE